MILPDDEADELRKWIIKKLETLDAVADTDVLADFVIALLRTETEESQLKEDAHGELKDFLQDHTPSFIDEVFKAVNSKTYLPAHLRSKPSVTALPQPTRSGAIDLSSKPENGPGPKKRKHNEMQGNEKSQPTNRQTKQPRSVRGRGSDRGRGGRPAYVDLDQPMGQNFPEMPIPMPDFPLDQYPDPFAAMQALQAMGFPALPMPQMQNGVKKKGRCHAYDNKGFCARGDACPYQHGDNYFAVPGLDDYDPKNPSQISSASRGAFNGARRGRGGRSSVAHTGPLHDRSATTVVVEQIPEERFNEDEVRSYFNDFGTIEDITLQPYKRIALVKYDSHDSAQAAYENPKAVFDNRFVKVYWHKVERPGKKPQPQQQGDEKMEDAPPPFDQEEFERKSQEAQRRLEEKKAQMKEMADKKEALQRQKIELAQKQLEEKRRLRERLAGKRSSSARSPSTGNGDVQIETQQTASGTTKALRAKLAELESEAASLGIDPSAPEEGAAPMGRGRGRGRGSYRGWEAFNPSYRGRGGYRGGGGRGSWNGGGKYNLDLRTRKVSVAGVDWTSERDEALRQYLLGIGDYEGIEAHPDRLDALIVNFKDRPVAEGFFYGTRDLPGVGKAEFSWFNSNGPAASTNGHGQTENGNVDGALDRDGDIGMKNNAQADDEHAHTGEVDYDIAEADERWN